MHGRATVNCSPYAKKPALNRLGVFFDLFQPRNSGLLISQPFCLSLSPLAASTTLADRKPWPFRQTHQQLKATRCAAGVRSPLCVRARLFLASQMPPRYFTQLRTSLRQRYALHRPSSWSRVSGITVFRSGYAAMLRKGGSPTASASAPTTKGCSSKT